MTTTLEHKQNSNMGKKVDAGGEKNGNRQKAIEGVEGEGKAIVHDEKTTEGKTVCFFIIFILGSSLGFFGSSK